MENKKKKIVTSIALFSAVAGGISVMSTFVNNMAKSLLYRHHKERDSEDLEAEAKSIYIKNSQGIKMRGIFLDEQEANKTLVILHPFALEANDMTLYIPFFKRKIGRCNILLIDALAHGQSDGYIRGMGIKDVEDLVAWNEHLIYNFGKEHQIILYGKETGANTILNAASKHVLKNVSAIISDGAYTSPYDILGYRLVKDYKVAKFPTLSLLKRKIYREVKIDIKESTVSLVKHNDIPTLYIHMRNDDFVPLNMVYPLYNANRGSKDLFILKDERYLYELKETDEFKSTLNKFINKYLK